MERYDYTANADVVGNVSAEIDRLSNQEMLAVHEAIQSIRKENKQKKSEQGLEQFRQMILPALKNYAELTCSLLEVEQERDEVIIATFRDTSGFDIGFDDRSMRIALITASHISIELNSDHKGIALVLAYDCNCF